MMKILININTERMSYEYGDGKLSCERLGKVALLVLIPHSNAQEEWVFSLVTTNKMNF